VDWITQAALGAWIGELMLGKRLGKRAMAWGALFGIAPNVDVILSLFLNTSHELAFRRGPTHSLVVIALAAFGLSRWLEKRWKPEKISRPMAGGLVFAAMAGHLLLESLTVEGASVFWPVSGARVAFNLIDRGDYLFSLPLVVTALWLAFLPRPIEKRTRAKKLPPPTKHRRLCYWGFGLTAAYTLLAVGMKWVAATGFEEDLKRRGATYQRRIEAPTRHNLVLWRAVVDRGDELWVGYRTVFEARDAPVRWTVYLRGEAALAGLENTGEIKTLTRITGGWWLARPHAKGAWLGDLRHGETRIWGAKKGMVDSRLAFSWLFNPTAKTLRLRQIDETGRDSGEMLNRTTARILGRHAQWEANPRLAGVPGSLPEFLPVEP
jgi:inner membrane protein